MYAYLGKKTCIAVCVDNGRWSIDVLGTSAWLFFGWVGGGAGGEGRVD